MPNKLNIIAMNFKKLKFRIAISILEFLRENSTLIITIILIIPIILFISFCVFVYRDLKASMTPNYAYALFAANALATNLILNLGRSPVFLKDYSEIKHQRLIYRSAVMFLFSAFLSLFTAGYIYLEKSEQTLPLLAKDINDTLVLSFVSVITALSIIFTIIGLTYFFRWCYIAVKLFLDEENDRLSKLQ
jgi:hypothetical protein